MESLYDVAIIGGGPAGSTAATFLARKGRKVIVLEKEKFPRFHIGESLLPYSMGAFERLGVREKLDAKFFPKYGAEVCTTCGRGVVKFSFKDAYRAKYDRAYQVTRSEFDKLLLDHSAESGATVMEQTTVEELAFGKDEVGLKIKSKAGAREIRARYVIDCSGRQSVIGNYFKLKKPYPNLKKFSIFAHYDNVTRDPGAEGTYSRLVRGSDRWFWMIPLSETKMSIGVVMNIADFKALNKRPEEALDDILREQPEIWSRMTQSTRTSEVLAESDYSYRNRQLSGERWLLAGDAAGFIDPMFSTGVFVAIETAEQAANAVGEALENERRRAAAFKKYERETNRVMNLYLRFVGNWYKPRFIEVMTHPVNRFQLVEVINSMLAGNIKSSFTLWSRMEAFYLVTYLQRYLPLCPRLSLNPKDSALVSKSAQAVG
ncbi:MAG TPA: NAD(P)/FAD-dependent oxidoreductase [Verrucomicrobiae bacterium]|nr:NAD(P)/FAD-dependent oxidoreductase [Verrucomicrobiae bacterium]